VGVGVGVGPKCAQYLPPVFKYMELRYPPQTIISLPAHTAANCARPAGALVVVVAIQLSVRGSYLPPVSKSLMLSAPPQTIISFPVHTAVWDSRADGAPAMFVAVQLSVLGSYLPPVLK
jgi:hypothetical protein